MTQGNWKEIMGTKPWNGQEGDKIALSCVSWNDAQAFINKLNAQSDKYQYRRHLCLETQVTAAATPAARKRKLPMCVGQRTETTKAH